MQTAAMAAGVHRRAAYAQAAKRMAWPITASTATTLAAFMPLLFWPGVVGEFMKFLPTTLIATLTASLAMALIFVPTVGSYVGRAGSTSPEVLAALAAGEHGDLNDIKGATGRYVRMLSAVVRHPFKVLIVAVALLIGVQTYYALHGNGVEFFPDVEPEFGQILVHARGNLSVDEMDRLVREVEHEVLQVPGLETVYTRVGTRDGGGQELSEDVVGVIQVEFKDWILRRPANEIFAEIQRRTDHLAGVFVEATEPDAGPPTGKPVQVHLSSRHPEAIEPVLKRILAKIRTIEGLIDIEDTRSTPGIEWQISVDREQAGRFGANVVHVGNVVKLVTNGLKVGDYRPDDADEEVDIRVRYPTDERTLNQLDTLRVSTEAGLIPISNFVDRTPQEKVGTVHRTDGRRALAIKADIAEGVLADDKVSEIRAWLDTQEFDPRVEIEFKGEDEEQKKAEAFLLKAFGIALFIMAIHPGHAVQQLLSRVPHPLRRHHVDDRRHDRAHHHRSGLWDRHDGRGRDHAGGRGRQQQHRSDRHLRPAARGWYPGDGSGRENGRTTPPPGNSYGRDDRARPHAHGPGAQHQPVYARHHRGRGVDPMVDPTGDRGGQRPDVCHCPDPQW